MSSNDSTRLRTYAVTDTEYLAPQTKMERTIANIWEKILGIEQIGIHNTFFKLGGNSLTLIRMFNEISKVGLYQDTTQLYLSFLAPNLNDISLDNGNSPAPLTIAMLASQIEKLQRQEQERQRPQLHPRVHREGAPLSFGQQRLWFLQELEPESTVYCECLAFRLEGKLDEKALHQALNEIVQRHEALRTSFLNQDGQLQQIILPVDSPQTILALLLEDLSALQEQERQSTLQEALRLESLRPFDLRQGPLLRTKLWRLQPEEYMLLLTIHHIISDGWSLDILRRELSILYTAFTQHHPSPLPPLPIQYADFALWQREWLQDEVLHQQLDYWRQKLAGAPPLLELPTDHPRLAVQTFRGAICTRELQPSLFTSLTTLSQREGVTLFMTVLAAFQILLARYTGNEDIVVGTPIANRTLPEIEGVVGFFVNTLVLRVDLSGNPSVRQLLEQVREVCLGAYTHQDLPFEKLVEELQLERALSYNPLFQVMLVVQNGPRSEFQFDGLHVSQLPSEGQSAKFDLTVELRETEDGSLHVAAEYTVDLFEEVTIQRLLGHFETLLTAMAAKPECTLDQLPLLTEVERQQLLVEWNATERTYLQDRCLHELFEEQVARTPDVVAVVFEEQHLTYADLNRRANQFAHYLRGAGVGPEVLVGICLERSVEMVIGLLGILKAGGAYVPLDPSYPKERLTFMLQDAQVRIVLTQQHLLERIYSSRIETCIFCLDSDWKQLTKRAEANCVSGVSVKNPAYIIYTSGSTGIPKGAMNTHQAVCNRLIWMQEAYHLLPSDHVLQKTSFSFDVSVWEFFWPLTTGAQLVLASPEGHKDTAYIVSLIREQNITTLHFVPSMFQLFLKESHLEKCSSLRQVLCSGEALPFELQQRFFLRHHAALYNLYGPTEAAIDVTAWTCHRTDVHSSPSLIIPIGRPIANIQIYLLDAQLQPVPVGVAGELYIGGIGLARGYWHRPELTAERFLPDPFGQDPGGRLYRTGDLARYWPDGTIEYLGRLDTQVKLRGYRIELGEIEAVLRQYPGVQEAVVRVDDTAAENKRLLAYLALESSLMSGPTHTELRSFLQERLPEYMLPSSFVFVDRLPLLPNGKIDRKALPTPPPSRLGLEQAYVPPETQIEEILANIWAQVLGLEKVGIYDNFFELGGDSILTIQMVSRARQADLHITTKQIFLHQTVKSLAACVVRIPQVTNEQELVVGEVPLTPIEHWFFDQQFPERHYWNQARLLKTRRRLRPDLLQVSLSQLVAHHDALRLRFSQRTNSWKQWITDIEEHSIFSFIDLSAHNEDIRTALMENMAAEYQRTLNFEQGPLIRVVLFDLGDVDSCRLLIIIHHLAVDGISWRVLLEDLQKLYELQEHSNTPSLPAKTTSFQRWSRELQEYATSNRVQQEVSYWRRLAEFRNRIVRLPIDYDEQRNMLDAVDIIHVEMKDDETRLLIKKAQKTYNVQFNEILLMALAQSLTMWTGAHTLLIDLEGHGREEFSESQDLSRTVGWFTTLFPLLLDLDKVNTPFEVLRSVKEQLRKVPQKGIGYGLLRYLCDKSEIRDLLHTLPQACVRFNYLGQFDQLFAPTSLWMPAPESKGPISSPLNHISYLLDIDAIVIERRLQLSWSYCQRSFNRQTIASVTENFLKTLRELIVQLDMLDSTKQYTPSDFPAAYLNQGDLDRLMQRLHKMPEGE